MEPLTEVQQELYFTQVVASLFHESHPTQYLFSYLKDGECIGYGGLVHIDYQRGSAELSFIMNTALERDEFDIHWTNYLHLIEKIAFEGLKFNRIFTYAYDLRPHLYPILAHAGFYLERILPNALIENDRSIPAVIHSKWNAVFRKATNNDLMVTFKWAQKPLIRQYSFNRQEISLSEHERWFNAKITDSNNNAKDIGINVICGILIAIAVMGIAWLFRKWNGSSAAPSAAPSTAPSTTPSAAPSAIAT